VISVSPDTFLKRLPGVGSKPGSSRFHLLSHFHHFTAEPQRLRLQIHFVVHVMA
jgi:hypothetical protein